MADSDVREVAAEYRRIADDPHHQAFLGRSDGNPEFLVETYDPAQSELAGLPELASGDLGMHVLVAPTEAPIRGFTSRVFRTVMEFCFADPDVARVVVEPDVGNERILAMNAAAGFTVARNVELATKTAALSFCSREAFAGSRLGARELAVVAPRAGSCGPASRQLWPREGTSAALVEEMYAGHLTPDLMERAQRALVAKAIAELAHERVLEPTAVGTEGTPVPPGMTYELAGPRSTYRFRARRHELDHWVLCQSSLEREVAGRPAALDAQEFAVEFAPALGIPDVLLPTYLEELASTLASSAWKLRHSSATAGDLVHADYQAIESAMTEGHPAFIANNGRIGFGSDDYAAYAPEAGRPVRLVWVAARRDKTQLSLSAGLGRDELYRTELGEETLADFARRLAGLGLAADDYLYLPVHPWQWTNKLAITFAPDLARHDLVCLGAGVDDYRAQQSIRTLFNVSSPHRHYVKVALAIQNMGFLRGLSPAYMRATPAINDWVAEVVSADAELRGCGFTVLRERAAIGYTGDAFHGLGRRTPYQKMIAALWRESPVPSLAPGERLATMASLLHRDTQGRALATAMIEASGRQPVDWLRSYLRGYLRPLVHCLYRYDLAFMPHGENLVMVLRDHVPVRMFMKDIGEEVAVMGELPLPPEVERIRVTATSDLRGLAIHTDVFDGFLRYLAAILTEDEVLTAEEFWAEVARCLHEHAADHPELADAAAAYDLFQPEFRRSCLNRLQLRNTLEMVDLADPAESLIFAGTLKNPIAPYRDRA